MNTLQLVIDNCSVAPQILRARGMNHGFNQNPIWYLDIIPSPIDLSALINQTAFLQKNNKTIFSGFIAKASSKQILLCAKSYIAAMQKNSIVYPPSDLKTFIQQCMKNAGLTLNDIDISQIKNNIVFNHVSMQYQTSYQDFLRSQLSMFSVFDFYNNGRYCFSDDLYYQYNKIDLNWDDRQGVVNDHVLFDIHWQYSLQASHVKLIHQQNLSTKNNLIIETKSLNDISSFGVQQFYFSGLNNLSILHKLADNLQQHLENQRIIIKLKTTCPDICPGTLIQTNNLNSPEHNFKALHVNHFYDQSTLNPSQDFSLKKPKPFYYNEVTAVLGEKTLAFAYKPKRTTSLEIAKVDGENFSIPYLDKKGNYYLRYAFDLKSSLGSGSQAARLLQPYIGKDAGHHWPLHTNTQALIHYYLGCIDNPVIVGTIPSANCQSNVTSSNQTWHSWQTFAGNAFNFNDEENNRLIVASTPNTEQSFQMAADDYFKSLYWKTAQGSIYFNANKNITTSTQGSLKHEIKNNQKIQAYEQQWSTKTGSIHGFANSNHELTAKKSIQSDIKVNGTLTSNQQILLQAKKNLAISTQNKDALLQIFNNKIFINSKEKLSIQTNKNLLISQHQANIKIDEQGNLTIKARKIYLKSENISIKGSKIDHEKLSNLDYPQKLPLPYKKHWLALNYLTGKTKQAAPALNYKIHFHDQSNLSGTTNVDGIGLISTGDHNNVSTILIPDQEIISINEKFILPSDGANITSDDLKLIEELKSPMKSNDDAMNIELLFSPIIVNLREDVKDIYSRETLTDHEINYFKTNQNNAVIFIHGFNVPYGDFSKQILTLKPMALTNSASTAVTYMQASEVPSLYPVYKTSDSTICVNNNILIQNNLPVGETVLPSDLSWLDSLLNGSGMHNWLVHMEDNLNTATHQFDHKDYSKYMRLINIAWSGDVGLMNYMEAEEPANQAGEKLLALIKQLRENDIKIYIIAHSLGNRVLLNLLNQVGLLFPNAIENCFLWQPAVVNTALSSDRSADKTLKQNSSFIYAHFASKKFVVLYSKKDDVLAYAYRAANELGFSPDQFLSKSYFKTQAEREKLSNQSIDTLAMGLVGPDENTRALLKNKLICVDQSDYLFGHSDIKIPNKTLMNTVYKNIILNPDLGIKQFGSY